MSDTSSSPMPFTHITVDSTVHSNAPTHSSTMDLKPLPFNYADVDPTIQPDAPLAPLPVELNPVPYSMVVHNQPQEQQYSTIGPSNPLVNNVQVDGEEYCKLNYDVHAKSMQSLHSAGYGKLQHPRNVFTTPQHQSTEEEYSTERKFPETSEDNCYCQFITSYNYLSYR